MKRTLYAVLVLSIIFILGFVLIHRVGAANYDVQPIPDPTESVLSVARSLISQYGSRPPYTLQKANIGQQMIPSQADSIIPYLIACESQLRNVIIVDSNGYYSYGILQIQSSTAADFNAIEHTHYDPMIPAQAIELSEIALEHGYIARWSCAKILKII